MSSSSHQKETERVCVTGKRKRDHERETMQQKINDRASQITQVDEIDCIEDSEFRFSVLHAYEKRLIDLMKPVLCMNVERKPETIEEVCRVLDSVPFKRIRNRLRLVRSEPLNVLVQADVFPGFLDFICHRCDTSVTSYDPLIIWEYGIELSYLLRLYHATPNRDLNAPVTISPVNSSVNNTVTTCISAKMGYSHVMLAVLLAANHITIDWKAVVPNTCGLYAGLYMFIYTQQISSLYRIAANLPRCTFQRRVVCLMGEADAVTGTNNRTSIVLYSSIISNQLAEVFSVFDADDHSELLYSEDLYNYNPSDSIDGSNKKINRQFVETVNQRRLRYRKSLPEMLLPTRWLQNILPLWTLIVAFMYDVC